MKYFKFSLRLESWVMLKVNILGNRFVKFIRLKNFIQKGD